MHAIAVLKLLPPVSTLLYKVVTEIQSANTEFDGSLMNIERNLSCLKSTLEDVKEANINLGIPDEKADKLVDCLAYGDQLVNKCKRIHSWNIIGKFKHRKNLAKFDYELTIFLQTELLMRINKNSLMLLVEMNKLQHRMDFHLMNSGYSSGIAFIFGLLIGVIFFGGKLDSTVCNMIMGLLGSLTEVKMIMGWLGMSGVRMIMGLLSSVVYFAVCSFIFFVVLLVFICLIFSGNDDEIKK